MPEFDVRVDNYIAKSAEFAQPILTYLREAIHAGCSPVEETIKWGMPFFVYKGNLCFMAAFKKHCAFGFWKNSLLQDDDPEKTANAMGRFGRITTIKDLPNRKTLLALIKEAAALNEQGVKAPKKPKVDKSAPLAIPDYFLKALRKNKKALETFHAFSPSNKGEYIAWVTEAKTEATRNRRMETAVEWMAEGKIRNWKYVKK
jgi:uncharacterized protein YdeI (YjbR/CyaY-like superfamily)